MKWVEEAMGSVVASNLILPILTKCTVYHNCLYEHCNNVYKSFEDNQVSATIPHVQLSVIPATTAAKREEGKIEKRKRKQ